VKTRRKYPCVCHPSRPHAALGLCPACYLYWKLWRRRPELSDRAKSLVTIVQGHEYRKHQVAGVWNREGKERKKRDPQAYRKGRNKSLKDRYGIDLEQFEIKHAEQNGACAICKQKKGSSSHRRSHPLYVDHCHKSKQVRGLLCARCNTLIGFLETAAHLVPKAVSYLEAHSL